MNVCISEGLRLDDDTAHRFASRMLDDLKPHFDRASRALAAISGFGSIGNPIGQKRTFDRLAKAYGPLKFYYDLQTGKRGRYTVRIVSFAIYGDTLGLDLLTFWGNGFKEEPGYTLKPIITFSLHALARMIQRADIRMGNDYIPMLREVMPTALIVGSCMAREFAADRPIPETWPVPVTISGKPAILLVCDSKQGAWVKTVYPGAWRHLPEFDGLASDFFLSLTALDFDRWIAAFKAAAPRFKGAM